MINRALVIPMLCASMAGVRAAAAPLPAEPAPAAFSPSATGAAAAAIPDDDRVDELYENARDHIEEGHYDRALAVLDRILSMNATRMDAALYWKAYSLAKLGQRADALNALADFQKRFQDSRWLRDAKALEVELRQASGQKVSPDSESDDELKLLALRGLMNSEPDQALPIIEKMLSGANSLKVKDRALFVLSQSQSARAREIIASTAKTGNPDLQLKAIRYLGIMGGPENRQLLADVYRASTDTAVKRAILRSFMVANDKERLFALAKSETDVNLRGEAVRQLGVMHASGELQQLYQTETAPEVKKSILQAMFVGGDTDKLIELAKSEKDPDLRKTAIRNLGLMRKAGTTDALTSIYASDQTPDVRKAVINALFLQDNAAALVTLARAEKNIEMKKAIISKLSLMKSKAATDYLMELLK
jgi:HEAT repeat protein